MSELLRSGLGLLLDLHDGATQVPPGAAAGVDVVRPIGPEGAPPFLLVRPDAITAWIPADGLLERALDRWF